MSRPYAASMQRVARVTLLLFAGCENWPNQDPSDRDENPGSASAPSPPPSEPSLSTSCRSVPARRADATVGNNGAYCFGVAAGFVDLFECAASTNAGESLCVDLFVYDGYRVLWRGAVGTVFDLAGTTQLGSVTARNGNSYVVSVLPALGTVGAAAVTGVCTVSGSGAQQQAKFCSYTE